MVGSTISTKYQVEVKVQKSGNPGFCIPYTVRETSDKGRGVFSGAAVSERVILWRHEKGQYAAYDERSFGELITNMTHGKVVYELTKAGAPEWIR